MEKTNIFFPIETINRELDYRLLLGALVANKRNRIFIGQHDAISRLCPYVEGGLYVGKHIFPRQFPLESQNRYRAFKEQGVVLIHLDEEGAVYTGGAEEWKRWLSRKLDVTCLAEEDHVLTWGDFQREFYLQLKPRCAAHVQTTGHPRFDLYKDTYRTYFAEDAEALRKRFGSFVLINTNLSFANNGLGLEHSFSALWGFNPTDPESRRRHFSRYAHDARIVVAFVELLNEISLQFPDLCFVLRPHPSEDRKFYKSIFGSIKNVQILHEGPVAPWILASDMVIHDGCTTGIESYLSGKPTFIYKMVEDPNVDCFLPNQFGRICSTHNEIIEAVRDRKALAERPPEFTETPLAKALLANLEHEAVSKVSRVIHATEEGHRACRYDEARFLMAENLHRGIWSVRGAVRHLFPERLRKHRLYRSMFYGFDEMHLSNRLDRIARMIGKRPQLKFYNQELFVLEGN